MGAPRRRFHRRRSRSSLWETIRYIYHNPPRGLPSIPQRICLSHSFFRVRRLLARVLSSRFSPLRYRAATKLPTCASAAVNLHTGTPHTLHSSPVRSPKPNGTPPIADVEPTPSSAPEATGRVQTTTDILTYTLSHCVKETSNLQPLARVVCSLFCLFRIATVVSHPHGGAQTHRSSRPCACIQPTPTHATNSGYRGGSTGGRQQARSKHTVPAWERGTPRNPGPQRTLSGQDRKHLITGAQVRV